MIRLASGNLLYLINMRMKYLKIIILASTFFVGVRNGFSQSYYHSPNDTLIENTILDAQVTMNITQVHQGNDTLHFFWNKLSVVMPFEWEANICDNSNCYTSLENSGATLPVLPGDDGLMLIHCTPHSVEGTATIRYTIFEEDSPSQVDTLTWIINATSAGINSVQNDANFIWVYENVLHVDGQTEQFNKICIFDPSGKILYESVNNGEKTFLIPSITSSLFYVELSGENKIYRQNILLQ